MEKPHESDNDDEEESGLFVQTETKPLKLPSRVVIKVEKDHWRVEEEKQARQIARSAACEAKEKEMTDAVAASQAEVAEVRRRQAETDSKQQALERQMAELMARMNPQAISSKAIVCCTRNRHSLVDFLTSYRCAPACCPTDRVGSKRSSRRRS